MATLMKFVDGSTRYLSTKAAMPLGSCTCARTVTAWLAAGSTGLWLTLKMGGPTFGVTGVLLLRAPGVPRLGGRAITPGASSQLPCNRNNNSGKPHSQRTLARKVAVGPPE